MYDYKPWYRSTGMIGSLIVLAGAALNLLGMHVSSEDMALLCKELTTLAGAVGGVMALVGRLKATASIGKPVMASGVSVGDLLQSIDAPATLLAAPIPAPQPAAPIPVQPAPQAPAGQ